MAKATRTGKELYLEFAGTPIDLDFRDFDPGVTEVSADSTAGADALTTTVKIRETVAPSFSILVQSDATGLAVYALLEHGAIGNLIWGSNGNGVGEPKWGIEARLMVNEVSNHGGERLLDVAVENTGRDWLFDGRTDTF